MRVMTHGITVFSHFLFAARNKKTGILMMQACNTHLVFIETSKTNIYKDQKYFTNYLSNFLRMILEIIHITLASKHALCMSWCMFKGSLFLNKNYLYFYIALTVLSLCFYIQNDHLKYTLILV